MPGYETLRYEERGCVAWVTLDRPEVLNSFDTVMMREIHRCWSGLRANDDVNAVVLTAAGDRAFCTGVDRAAAAIGDDEGPRDIGQQGATPLHFDDPGDWLPPKTAGRLWKPVIAAVNGMACGGAFYLLAEADIIIAAEHATFFDPHTSYGMAAVFEPMMMLQRMPLGEVLRISLMGAHERMTARRAREIGLVQEVVPGADLAATAAVVAEAIASQPARAVQATVRAVWYAQDLGYRQALDVGKTLVRLGTDDDDLAEGQALFASGRRIPWQAR
ncbi:enoyl-CoA hydratase/isomerase family protein [Streptomyces sp. WMMC500]|uniref:enoyl-CoA hydratase/isomerase family protein n=1 Tax=Streptomyces sp. WMMC500 TaxID=3015154 RepID=UPI00248C503D|nr:enoyl-CoA hydratase/isomerase family protein [Streptomyces sp. WMMC500]WBB61271.1 enoyl-CoA hydratase/isomerase family protein [Streptomyces sp. WMMC500]